MIEWINNYVCLCVTALSQYSGDPRTEWQLSNFTSKDQLLDAVRNFRYKGGNTFTGENSIFNENELFVTKDILQEALLN